MTVIIDTHAFVWWLTADPRLSRTAFEVITDPRRVRYLSAVTAFELTTKVRIGKLEEANEIVERFNELMQAGRFTPLPIEVSHAYLAGRLPGKPRDPFDRLIAAQASVERVPVLSRDGAFRLLGVETVW